MRFEIKKADRGSPNKPEYESDEHSYGDEGGIIKIINPQETDAILQYKIEWYDTNGKKHEKVADLNTAKTSGFKLTTSYTNYYVYVRYVEEDNYIASQWVRANAVLFYKGKVYIHISEEMGINYSNGALDGTAGGLEITLSAADGYYLYDTKIVQEETEGATLKIKKHSSESFKITGIPDDGTDVINLYLSISGVRKTVKITPAVAEGEVFGQVKGNLPISITRDSAYTAYFEIENFGAQDANGNNIYTDPGLVFGSSLPEGTTVILIDKSAAAPRYWYCRLNAPTSSLPLGSFTSMSGGDAPAVADTMKYQVVVDFSDTSGTSYNSLTTCFGASVSQDNQDKGAPQISCDAAVVNLTSTEAASLSIKPDGTRQTVTVTVPEGSAASSKWQGRSTALVLSPQNGIPADACIEAKDYAGNRKPYYQNANGYFVIPLGSGGEQTVTLSLVSDMFDTVEATKHVFDVSLISIASAASASVGNGTVLAAMDGVINFDKPEKTEQPAISITSEMNVCEYGGDICITVNAVGVSTTGQDATNGDTNKDVLDYTLTLRLYNKKVDDSGKESYVDSGWKPTGDKAQLGKNTVPLGTLTGSCCIVAQLLDSEKNVVAQDTYYFVIVK